MQMVYDKKRQHFNCHFFNNHVNKVVITCNQSACTILNCHYILHTGHKPYSASRGIHVYVSITSRLPNSPLFLIWEIIPKLQIASSSAQDSTSKFETQA